MDKKKKKSLDSLNDPSMLRGAVTSGIMTGVTGIPGLIEHGKGVYAKNLALSMLVNGPVEAGYQKIRNIKGDPVKRNIQGGAEVGALTGAAMGAVKGTDAVKGTLLHKIFDKHIPLLGSSSKERALAALITGTMGGVAGGAMGAVEGSLEKKIFGHNSNT